MNNSTLYNPVIAELSVVDFGGDRIHPEDSSEHLASRAEDSHDNTASRWRSGPRVWWSSCTALFKKNLKHLCILFILLAFCSNNTTGDTHTHGGRWKVYILSSESHLQQPHVHSLLNDRQTHVHVHTSTCTHTCTRTRAIKDSELAWSGGERDQTLEQRHLKDICCSVYFGFLSNMQSTGTVFTAGGNKRR